MLDAARTVVIAAGLVCWWLLSARNGALREAEREAAVRAQLLREIQGMRMLLLEAQASMPEPGTGDAPWWRERIFRQAAKDGLSVTKFEARPSDLAVGPFALDRREIVLVGAYDAALKFMGWLETSTPRMRIEHFTVNPEGPAGVRATFTILMPRPGAKK